MIKLSPCSPQKVEKDLKASHDPVPIIPTKNSTNGLKMRGIFSSSTQKSPEGRKEKGEDEDLQGNGDTASKKKEVADKAKVGVWKSLSKLVSHSSESLKSHKHYRVQDRSLAHKANGHEHPLQLINESGDGTCLEKTDTLSSIKGRNKSRPRLFSSFRSSQKNKVSQA